MCKSVTLLKFQLDNSTAVPSPLRVHLTHLFCSCPPYHHIRSHDVFIAVVKVNKILGTSFIMMQSYTPTPQPEVLPCTVKYIIRQLIP